MYFTCVYYLAFFRQSAPVAIDQRVRARVELEVHPPVLASLLRSAHFFQKVWYNFNEKAVWKWSQRESKVPPSFYQRKTKERIEYIILALRLCTTTTPNDTQQERFSKISFLLLCISYFSRNKVRLRKGKNKSICKKWKNWWKKSFVRNCDTCRFFASRYILYHYYHRLIQCDTTKYTWRKKIFSKQN